MAMDEIRGIADGRVQFLLAELETESCSGYRIGDVWGRIINDPKDLAIIARPDYLHLFATRLRRIMGEITSEDEAQTERGVKICVMHATWMIIAPTIETAPEVLAAFSEVGIEFGHESMTGDNELTANVILIINATVAKARAAAES
jgi:hypothetical protein